MRLKFSEVRVEDNPDGFSDILEVMTDDVPGGMRIRQFLNPNDVMITRGVRNQDDHSDYETFINTYLIDGDVEDEYRPLLLHEYELWQAKGDPTRPPERGRYKITFFYNGYVRKAPISEVGWESILDEVEAMEDSEIPIARSELEGQVLMQEELSSMATDLDKIWQEGTPKEEFGDLFVMNPWLEDMIDGQQVGYDAGGELRAFDGFTPVRRISKLKFSDVVFDREDRALWDKENDFRIRPVEDKEHGVTLRGVWENIDSAEDNYLPLVYKEWERWEQFGDPTKTPRSGRHKITFFYGGYVRKVPLNGVGDSAIKSEMEFMERHKNAPIVYTEMDGKVMVQEEIVKDLTFEIRRGEGGWVQKYPWIGGLLQGREGAQVGLTADGQVKAFDAFERLASKKSSILDPIQDELDQRVFDGDEPRAELFDPYLKELKKRIDEGGFNPNAFTYWFNGSLCTYQYGPGSDVDISVIAKNPDDFSEEDRAEMIRIACSLDSETLSDDIPYPLQHFVQPASVNIYTLFGAGLKSAWNIEDHKWLIRPNKDRSVNIEEEHPDWLLESVQITDKINTLLDAGMTDEAWDVYVDIHKKRKEAFNRNRSEADASQENVNYKYLDRVGVRDRLRNLGFNVGV